LLKRKTTHTLDGKNLPISEIRAEKADMRQLPYSQANPEPSYVHRPHIHQQTKAEMPRQPQSTLHNSRVIEII
jgi:hypothetical protein